MANTEMLKKRMAEIGITQTELANILGIATPTMSQKLNNLRPFSLDEADATAQALNISNEDFRLYFFAR